MGGFRKLLGMLFQAQPARRHRTPRRARLGFERLEARELLSASNLGGILQGPSNATANTYASGALTGPVWSGYAIVPGSQVTEVVGTWVQPAVSSTGASSIVSFWVGLDGFGNKTVEQIGTSWSATRGYYAWVEFYGDGVPNGRGGYSEIGPYFHETPLNSIIGSNYFNIQPGDTISASVTYIGSTSSTSSFEFQLVDTPKNGQTKSWQEELTTEYVVPQRSTAEWIVESPSGATAPLGDFGTVQFSKAWATAGGLTGPITSFKYYALDLVPSAQGGGTDYASTIVNTTTKVAVGFRLTVTTTSNFTVTFASAYGNAMVAAQELTADHLDQGAGPTLAGPLAMDSASLPTSLLIAADQGDEMFSANDAFWADLGDSDCFDALLSDLRMDQ